MHIPTQSSKNAIHTPKHENFPEEASLEPNIPNYSFINIDSDTDSLDKMMPSFE